MNITYTCPDCGSDDVHIGTRARWHVDTQQWIDDDDDPFAQADCNDCGWYGVYADLVEIPAREEE